MKNPKQDGSDCNPQNNCNQCLYEMQHDFGDGEVPAHKHPNGGGWVANTALVAKEAFIGPNAVVYGNACIFEDAKIYDYVQIFGEAKIFGDASVHGYTKIYGKAIIFCSKRSKIQCKVNNENQINKKIS